jgi:Zn-dependent peptidase ImmA (M78 family)
MRIFGDKARFALGFQLITDPDQGSPPLRRVSWGQLQIWVAGRNLTAGISPNQSVVDCAEVPLAPLVAWIAKNWDPMLHETRLPLPSKSLGSAAWCVDCLISLPDDDSELDKLLDARASWRSRHGLGSSLPDFRIPDLHLRRVNAGIELSWDDRAWRSVPDGMRLQEASGTVILPAEEVANILCDWASGVANALRLFPESAEFVEEMQTLLANHRTAGSALSRLKWAAGQHLKQAAQDARRLAGAFADGEMIDETIQVLLGLADNGRAGLITPITIPAMLFRSASPELSTSDLRRLSEAFAQLPRSEDCSLTEHQQADPPTSSPENVFQDGYEKALACRSALDINPELPLLDDNDLELVILPSLGIAVQDLTLESSEIDGMAVFVPGKTPLIGVNLTGKSSSTPWGRRMTLAHELCHLLYDLSDESSVGILSNPWAPELLEKRANAFAAMLMMPREALETVLPLNPRQWTLSGLSYAMKSLGVGRTALMNHLYNLGFIGFSEKEAWLDEL